MPDRIISAEAIISAKDNTGDVFARIGRKVADVGKGAKASVEIDRMAKSLTELQGQMKALDKYTGTSRRMQEASVAYRKAQQDARSLGREIAAAEKPTKAMEASFKRAQRTADEMAASFKKQGSALREARAGLEAFGIPTNQIAASQSRVRREIDSTTRAIEHQIVADHKAVIAHAQAEKAAEKRAHAIAHHGFTNFALGAAAGAVGVHSVLRTGEAAWEAGAERQKVVTGMRNAGISQAEIERAQALATRVSRDAPNLSISQIMELHKEARSAVQHPEETFELMPDLARAASVLKGMGSDNANVADLVKAGESLGLMNDPKRFHQFLSGQVKAMAVMGRTIDTSSIYEAAKYSKSAGATLSDDFLNLTMPSLIQEMHGSSAGDALWALTKRWRGGLAHQHLAVTRLNQLGLLDDPSQIKRSKSGEIMGYMGKLKGDDLLGSDPGKFFQDVFKPAAEKAGFKTLADQIKLLNETLPSTAANLGRILIQQDETLKQHRANYEGAAGLDEAVENQKKSWDAAVVAFKASLDDLGAAVTGPVLPDVTKGLSWLGGEIKSFSEAAANHPFVSVPVAGAVGAGALAGAGYLSYQFMTAGTSLQTAAVELQGAAAMLRGGGALSKVPGVVLGGGAALAPEAGALVGGGALGVGASLAFAGGIAGTAWLIKASHEAQRAGRGGAWAPATFATRGDDEDALADQRRQLLALRAQIFGRKSKQFNGDLPGSGFDITLQVMQDQARDLENEIAARERSLRLIPQFPIGMGGGMPTMFGGSLPQYSKKGQSLFPGVVPSAINESSGLPTFAQIPTMSGQPTGPITPAGPSRVELVGQATVRIDINAPPGVVGGTSVTGAGMIKPSVGATMTHAAMGQGGIGHN